MIKPLEINEKQFLCIKKYYFEEKLSVRKIQNVCNVSRNFLEKLIKQEGWERGPKPLTLEIKTEIEKLFFEGLSNTKISEKCNVTLAQVKGYLKSKSLYRNDYEHLSIQLTDNEKKQILKLYEGNWAIDKISRSLNRTEEIVSNFLHKDGHFKIRVIHRKFEIPYKDISINDDIDINNEFIEQFKSYFYDFAQYARFPINELSHKFKISEDLIEKLMNQYDINYTFNRKYVDDSVIKNFNIKYYSFDENYFENIEHPDKAYWLGFICSDGNLHEDKKNLRIEIHPKDVDILEKFNECLNSNYPIRYRENKVNKSNKFNVRMKLDKHFLVRISLTSDKLTNQLKNCYIMSNKTKKLNWNNISSIMDEKLWIDFIRGYFDGDGCWGLSYYKNNIVFTYNIGGASYNMINGIFEYLKNTYNLSNKVHLSITDKGYDDKFYSFTFSNKHDVLALYNAMYYDETCLKGNRKYNKAVEGLKLKKLL